MNKEDHQLCFSTMNVTCSYFRGKAGRTSRSGKSIMLEKQDFEQWNFHNLWDQCFEENGNGARIRLPIKVRLNLSWSPKFSAVENGTLANPLRMPLEKLTADFVHIFLLSAKTLWGWYSVASYWDFCTVLQSPPIFLILSAVLGLSWSCQITGETLLYGWSVFYAWVTLLYQNAFIVKSKNISQPKSSSSPSEKKFLMFFLCFGWKKLASLCILY